MNTPIWSTPHINTPYTKHTSQECSVVTTLYKYPIWSTPQWPQEKVAIWSTPKWCHLSTTSSQRSILIEWCQLLLLCRCKFPKDLRCLLPRLPTRVWGWCLLALSKRAVLLKPQRWQLLVDWIEGLLQLLFLCLCLVETVLKSIVLKFKLQCEKRL